MIPSRPASSTPLPLTAAAVPRHSTPTAPTPSAPPSHQGRSTHPPTLKPRLSLAQLGASRLSETGAIPARLTL